MNSAVDRTGSVGSFDRTGPAVDRTDSAAGDCAVDRTDCVEGGAFGRSPTDEGADSDEECGVDRTDPDDCDEDACVDATKSVSSADAGKVGSSVLLLDSQ